MSPRPLLAAFALPLLLCAPLAAQWGSDPAVNLAVADGASDQTQPKLAARSDGSTWVSWFDGIGSGFDVRAQLLGPDGAEVLAHNGVLVADRGFSSTQDYGLATSSSGDALLAFRDDRFAGTQITAARVTSAGGLAWGANGVQLTNTGAFVAAPKIAGTADGGAVVAWTQDATVRLRKIAANGTLQWPADVVLTPGVGSYSVADLRRSGANVILSFVHQTGGFGSPRRLVAQKFDPSGALLWGAGHVQVFTTGSLQFGNFPDFVTDASGGAVFSWYDAGSLALQCYVQRLDGNGAELFAPGGVAVSTNATRVRVSPHAAFDPVSGATLVSWVELTSNQAQSGVWSQKLDGAGNRLWGTEGLEVVPVSTTQVGNVRQLVSADTSSAFWVTELAFGDDRVRGQRRGPSGAALGTPFDVSSASSGKSRLAAVSSAHGQSILAWVDDRTDAGDVYAQNVNCDTSLGPPTNAWTDLGNALAGFSGPPSLTGTGCLCPGAPYSVQLANARPSSPLAIVLGTGLALAPLKGGVLVPTPDQIFFTLSSNAGGGLFLASEWPATLPSGFDLFLQIWVTDAAGPVGFAASNGLRGSVP